MPAPLKTPYGTIELPYPGLRPFRREESIILFGLDDQIVELMERLGHSRFLAVVGSSGSGKSSLVKAGLIPKLNSSLSFKPGTRWSVATMQPMQPLDSPRRNLARALLGDKVLGPQRKDVPEAEAHLLATLSRGPFGLVEALDDSPLPNSTNLLLIVDQFEEIFRFRKHGNPDEADAFVALLLASAESSRHSIYVILTMRSDYLGDCDLFPGLPEALNRSQYLTPRLNLTQRTAAIEGPARVFGGEVEPALVEMLLNDMGSTRDQLPLMQHILMRLWRNAVAKNPDNPKIVLTLEDYHAFGGIKEALNNHANAAYKSIHAGRDRRIARVMFQALCEFGDQQRDARRPTSLGEIAKIANVSAKDVAEVVEIFRDPELSCLIPARPEVLAETKLLDISHESLIRQWKQLRKWIRREAASAKQYARLSQTAHLWDQTPRQAGLWGTPDLDQALAWLAFEKPNQTWAERYGGGFSHALWFLIESIEERRQEEQRVVEDQRKEEQRTAEALKRDVELKVQKERAREQEERAHEQARAATWFRRISALALAAAVVAIGMSVSAYFSARDAKEALGKAEEQRRHAEDQTKIAEDQTKIAQRQSRIANAQRLAFLSQSSFNSTPQRALLFAIEAVRATRDNGDPVTPTAEQVLRQELAQTGGSIVHDDRGYSVVAVSVKPDRWRVVTWDDAGRVFVRDLKPEATGATAEKREIGKGGYRKVALSPNGRFLVARHGEGLQDLWDLDNSSKPSVSLKAFPARGSDAMAISPDSRWLIADDGNAIGIWDLEHPDADPILAHAPVVRTNRNAFTFMTDNLGFLVGYENGDVEAWRRDSSPESWVAHGTASAVTALFADPGARLPRVFPAHSNTIMCVAYSLDGKLLATASHDKTVLIWNLTAANPAKAPRILSGHREEVISVAFSPDGKSLASGSWDNSVRIWDLAATDPTKSPRVLTGHTHAVTSVAYAPDGKSLASGASDNTVRIWDLKAADATKQSRILTGHNGAVVCITYARDGKSLASGSEDKTIRIWNLMPSDSAKQPRVLEGHLGQVNGVTYSQDGKSLASASSDQTVRVWNLTTDSATKEPRILSGHQGEVRGVSYAPDGKSVASASTDKTVRIWDLTAADPNKQPRILTGHQEGVYGIAFAPDGKSLASGSGDKTVRIWDTTVSDPSGRSFQVGKSDGTIGIGVTQGDELVVRNFGLSRHEGAVNGLLYAPDGRTISFGKDGTTRIWDSHPGATKPEVILRGHDASVLSAAVTADGKGLLTGGAEGTVRLWRLDRGSPVASPEVFKGAGDVIRSVAVSPNGKLLVAGGNTGQAMLWRLDRPEQPASVLPGHEGMILASAFSHDGKLLATGDQHQGIIRLWSLDPVNSIAPLKVLDRTESPIHALAFSPDGRWLISGERYRDPLLWDLTKKNPVPVDLKGHGDFNMGVVFNPDGKRFVSFGHVDGGLRLGSIDKPEDLPLTLKKDDGPILAAAFDNMGTKLITVGKQGTARQWDLAEKDNPDRVLRTGILVTQNAALTSDGQRLATDWADNTLRLWDLTNLTAEPVVMKTSEQISSLAFSPDDTRLIAGTNRGSVLSWEMRIETLIKLAQDIVGRKLTKDEWMQAYPGQEYAPDQKSAR